MPSNFKTVLCTYYEKDGYCRYGDKCNFAHGQKELKYLRNIYYNYDNDKVELGQEAEEYDEEYYDQEQVDYGHENYTSDNQFGFNNSKFDIKKHPLYKTEMCWHMKVKGICEFSGCSYAHDLKELRKKPDGHTIIKI